MGTASMNCSTGIVVNSMNPQQTVSLLKSSKNFVEDSFGFGLLEPPVGLSTKEWTRHETMCLAALGSCLVAI